MLQILNQYFDITPLQPLVYLINKPLGFSSFTIVDIFKHILNDKVGHAGTLDPLATGDLLLLTGHTTKLANNYLAFDKTYKTTALIGCTTASYDLETQFSCKKTSLPDINTIKSTFKLLKEKTEYKVGSYSALKHKGKPLYKDHSPSNFKIKTMQLKSATNIRSKTITYAQIKELLNKKLTLLNNSISLYNQLHKELNVPIRKKQMSLFYTLTEIIEQNINSLKSDIKYMLLDVTLHVSKGTYVRSIIESLGQELNLPITTLNIHRTKSYN